MTETILQSVSVYRSGCLMSRTATVDLVPGTQTLRLLGPGPGADASSLRLSVPESLRGSNVQMEYLTEAEKEAALEELKGRLDKIGRQIAETQEQIALWKQNADFSAKENVSLQDMTAFLEQLPSRIRALNEEQDRLLTQQKELAREWDKQCKRNNLPYVSVELTAPEAGSYPLELRYQDHAAAWAPSYEIHVQDEESGQLQLRLRARIAQDTEEDWKQVKLTLYSGNPSISGTIPTLHPARLAFYENVPPMPAKNAMLGKARKDIGATMVLEECVMDSEMPAPMVKMSQLVADSGETLQGDTMTEYVLNSLWDIRNGQSVLCDIRTDEIPCSYQVVAVPKLSDGAYLSAQVKTQDLEEMQQVEAAVYLKGTFAGNVFLDPDLTEENYHLSLGVDETVKVKRVQKKRYTSQQLLKGQKKTELEYEIAVSSRKPKACQVLVQDQIPVTEEKGISVEVQNLSNGTLEEKTGLIKWQFDLQPGEGRTLALAYTVAWPKDKEIIGY